MTSKISNRSEADEGVWNEDDQNIYFTPKRAVPYTLPGSADADKKPVAVYSYERDATGKIVLKDVSNPDSFKHLKAMPTTTVKPNIPSATQMPTKTPENSGLIDLYSERLDQHAKGQTQSLRGPELETAESLKAKAEDPNGLIDLYSERVLKRKRT